MRLGRRLRDVSIFTRISLTYVGAILLPAILMLGYSAAGMLDASRKELESKAHGIAREAAAGVENVLEPARSVTAQLSSNQVLQNFLRRRYTTSLASMEYYRDVVRGIMVYARDVQSDRLAYARVFMANRTIPESWEFFFGQDRLDRYAWHADFSLDAEGVWIHPARSGLPTDLLDLPDEPVVAYARSIHTPSGVYLGVALAAIRVAALGRVLDGAGGTEGEAWLVDTANGTLVTRSTGAPAEPREADGGRIQVRTTLADGRFTLITSLETAAARRSILFRALQIFGGIIAGLGILEVVTLLYLRHLGMRFERMRAMMHRVAEGDFGIRVPQDRGDEIGSIARDFNVLIAKINDLVVDSVRKETAQRDAQLRALQLQINPHFIYNTLDSFRMKLVMAEQYGVADGLAQFGNMLRYNMDTQNVFTTLGQEIEHVKRYLAVQALRYEDRVRVVVDVAPPDLGIRTLKFVLQPMVENCLAHALRDDGSPLHLSFRGERVDGLWVLRVEDDGKGMCPERLEAVRASLDRSPDNAIRSEGPGIGLINIHARLRLYFGEGCGLSLESTEGVGTVVALRFPVARETLP